MQKCDEARRWPGSPDSVPEGEFDEFAAHAETCPYHGELMRSEEESLLSVLRLASCLAGRWEADGAGSESGWWAEHTARYGRWAASGRSVRSVALRYRGEEVARHEEFDEIDARIVRELMLEPEPDVASELEIWKLADDEDDEDVLLGVYPLGGFRHVGKAKYLGLPNGQTVVLNVRHIIMNKYEIVFTCADGELDVWATQEPETEMPPVWRREQPHGCSPPRAAAGMPLWPVSTAYAPPVLLVVIVVLLCAFIPRAVSPPGYTRANRSAEPKGPSLFSTTEASKSRRPDQDGDVASAPTKVTRAARPPGRVFYDQRRHRLRYVDSSPAPGGPAAATPGASRPAYYSGCEALEEPVEQTAEVTKAEGKGRNDAYAGETSSRVGDAMKSEESRTPREEAAAGIH